MALKDRYKFKTWSKENHRDCFPYLCSGTKVEMATIQENMKTDEVQVSNTKQGGPRQSMNKESQ